MTKDEAITLLRRRQGRRSMRQFAEDIGVSAAYLSDVYRGNRDLGPKLLKLVRVRKHRLVTVTYEAVR